MGRNRVINGNYNRFLFCVLLKEEEVDLGWNIVPVFLKDNINYGSFSLPLIVPTQPMTAPIKDPKKAKTLETVVNLDFQEWKEII